MSDPMKQAWTDVGDHFSALGRMMKGRYQGTGSDDAEDAPGEDAGNALRDALDKVVSAAKELGDRTADVARDDDVKAEAKRAAGSLNDALSATVDLIGERVGGLFKQAGDNAAAGAAATSLTPPADDAVPASEPPADDARQ